MERRELFKSFIKPFKKDTVSVVRAPYFKDEKDFLNGCVDCEDKSCINACQEDIIILDKDKTPILNLQISGCTYCDECANICSSDILKIEYKTNIDFNFSINTVRCLSWNNTMCFSCKDPCLDNAIIFNNMFSPVINMDKCSSCGFCVGVCPNGAIEFQKKENNVSS